jgi:uncharacterized membrane protein
LLSHPSYPSLHSVTGVLDHFDIQNLPLEVPNNLETLKQLPEVFLSLVNAENKKEFVIVTQKESVVEILRGNKNKQTISISDFITIWSGIIVIIEKSSITIQSNNVDNKKVIKAFSILVLVFLLTAFLITKPNLFQSLYFLLSLVGVFISYILVKHELGFYSKTVEKLCASYETTSCDAVLNSKGATVFKYYKLSDLCIVYFMSITIAAIFLLGTNNNYSFLILLSFASIPIILYSIYYQFYIIKKWCPLCIVVIAILWLQIITSYFGLNFFSETINIDFRNSFILAFSFVIVTALWLFVKPLIIKEKDLEKVQIDYHRFKRNFELFKAAYLKNEQINTSIDNDSEIIFGNKNAAMQIVLITNPLCFYCKSVHTLIEKILKQNPDDVTVTIRFNINTQDKSNLGYKVISKLHEIYFKDGKNHCLKAMNEAYEDNVNLNTWIDKWGESSLGKYDQLLNMQQNWCINNIINFTPALFINGRAFPKEYDRSDLVYFIDDLVENEY